MTHTHTIWPSNNEKYYVPGYTVSIRIQQYNFSDGMIFKKLIPGIRYNRRSTNPPHLHNLRLIKIDIYLKTKYYYGLDLPMLGTGYCPSQYSVETGRPKLNGGTGAWAFLSTVLRFW